MPAPAAPPAADSEAATSEEKKVTMAAQAPAVSSRVAASSGFVREAAAADLALGPRQSVFGISVDPTEFERIKTAIEHGSRPSASSVNVEALVNYFAGAPKRVRRDVQLEAEGSPAPVDGARQRGFVRFTVDTRTAELEGNASIPPVATNAHVQIEFNSRAVASFHRVGDTDPVAPEPTLLGNTSVTGLYEIELKPGVTAQTRIATVQIRYKSLDNGRERTQFAIVKGSDFARQWTLASRRHRLASLGAVWAESLKGSGGASDVAERAEELATQSPNDAKARELAAAASASAGSW
jgi:hypothetical protein